MLIKCEIISRDLFLFVVDYKMFHQDATVFTINIR